MNRIKYGKIICDIGICICVLALIRGYSKKSTDNIGQTIRTESAREHTGIRIKEAHTRKAERRSGYDFQEVLYEKNGIKITAYDIETDVLCVSVENNGQKDIAVVFSNTSVNQEMTRRSPDGIIVNAGEQRTAGVWLSGYVFEGITDIETHLYISEADGSDKIIDEKICQIDMMDIKDKIAEEQIETAKKRTRAIYGNEISLQKEYKTQISSIEAERRKLEESVWETSDFGETLVDEHAIQIVEKGLVTWSDDESELLLFIDNKTEENITVQITDIFVDGYKISEDDSSIIDANKKKFVFVNLCNTRSGPITDIGRVEMRFRVDTEKGEPIYESDTIGINFL